MKETAITKSPEQIQREMEALRTELDEDVDEIVDSARVLADWKHYVRKYPWACLGAAAAVGFAVVPRRLEVFSPDADTLLKLAKKNRVVIETKPQATPTGPSGALFTFLTNALMRGAMAYAGQRLGSLFEQDETNGSKP